MRVGVISTSWPSVRLPWAGHFVADLAAALADQGSTVAAVAPAWKGDGGLLSTRAVRLAPCTLRGEGSSLARRPTAWPRVLAALRRGVDQLEPPQVWLAHWWPTVLALPSTAPCVAVLHGSDMDLLERLPRMVAQRLRARAEVVSVASPVAERFAARAGGLPPDVCPLGARRATSSGAAPRDARGWLAHDGPRVLTIARAAPGKGLSTARRAADLLRDEGVAWYIGGGEPALSPAAVRSLLRSAHLCVVPSRHGVGLPREGRPHVIAQALVAHVPLVGGPNPAVRRTLAAAGQVEVRKAGAEALAQAVREALARDRREALVRAAQEAARSLTWRAVLPTWWAALERALSR